MPKIKKTKRDFIEILIDVVCQMSPEIPIRDYDDWLQFCLWDITKEAKKLTDNPESLTQINSDTFCYQPMLSLNSLSKAVKNFQQQVNALDELEEEIHIAFIIDCQENHFITLNTIWANTNANNASSESKSENKFKLTGVDFYNPKSNTDCADIVSEIKKQLWRRRGFESAKISGNHIEVAIQEPNIDGRFYAVNNLRHIISASPPPTSVSSDFLKRFYLSWGEPPQSEQRVLQVFDNLLQSTDMNEINFESDFHQQLNRYFLAMRNQKLAHKSTYSLKAFKEEYNFRGFIQRLTDLNQEPHPYKNTYKQLIAYLENYKGIRKLKTTPSLRERLTPAFSFGKLSTVTKNTKQRSARQMSNYADKGKNMFTRTLIPTFTAGLFLGFFVMVGSIVLLAASILNPLGLFITGWGITTLSATFMGNMLFTFLLGFTFAAVNRLIEAIDDSKAVWILKFLVNPFMIAATLGIFHSIAAITALPFIGSWFAGIEASAQSALIVLSCFFGGMLTSTATFCTNFISNFFTKKALHVHDEYDDLNDYEAGKYKAPKPSRRHRVSMQPQRRGYRPLEQETHSYQSPTERAKRRQEQSRKPSGNDYGKSPRLRP